MPENRYHTIYYKVLYFKLTVLILLLPLNIYGQNKDFPNIHAKSFILKIDTAFDRLYSTYDIDKIAADAIIKNRFSEANINFLKYKICYKKLEPSICYSHLLKSLENIKDQKNNDQRYVVYKNIIENLKKTSTDSLIFRHIEKIGAFDYDSFDNPIYYFKSQSLAARVYYRGGNFVSAFKHINNVLSNPNNTLAPYQTARMYNALGLINSHIGNYPYARKNMLIALEMFNSLPTDTNLPVVENNISELYLVEGKLDSALIYIDLALERTRKDKHNKEFLALSLLSKGEILMRMGELDKARLFIENSIDIANRNNSIYVKITSADTYGRLYQRLDNHEMALRYLREALDLSLNSGVKMYLKSIYKDLSVSYTALGKYKEANECFAEHYKREITTSNSRVFFQLNYNMVIASELYQKQNTLLSKKLNDEQEMLTSLSTYKSAIIIVSALFVLILSTLLIFFARSRKRAQRRFKENNNLIMRQKEELNIRNIVLQEEKEITKSSLKYAKKIQQALTTPFSEFERCFNNNFLIFMPKTIISGDFYWIAEKDNKVYFSLADCTGHGIPGAFMSIIGTEGLNKVFKERKSDSPADMLRRLNTYFKSTLRYSDHSIDRDGMDIALCVFDKGTNELTFSGAKSSILICRNSALEQLSESYIDRGDTNIYQIEGVRRSIGFSDNNKIFTDREIQIFPGDTLYMATDGYYDQFGGSANKKLKLINFKRKLLEYNNYSLKEQRSILLNDFEKWKGFNEQIDDISIVGIRF
jgi:serine phosphatase RsbU (regulator of sigma subunit)